MIKRLLWLTAALAAVVVLVAGWQVFHFLNSAVKAPEEGLTFVIRPGTPFVAVSEALAERDIIDRPLIFSWYARLQGKGSSVRAGEYRLAAGMTPPDLLRSFVNGNVVLHSFTIVEGWTFREMLDSLARNDAVKKTFSYDEWPALLESLESDAPRPEGLFLPETYHFPRHTKDVKILRQAFELMEKTLAAEWSDRAEGLPLSTPYEALILASIVEKETARVDERARIAGVFVRRLQKGMRLQTDPTVIYGLGEAFDGNLTRADLRTDTPYNTYTRSDLPPTPIALPGRAAIHAALHPAPGEDLYFVATGLGDGSHAFSATRAEHNAAVQAYLARLRDARDAEAAPQ